MSGRSDEGERVRAKIGKFSALWGRRRRGGEGRKMSQLGFVLLFFAPVC